MMTTTTTVAVGGATPKDDETGYLLPAVATAGALQNVFLFPPPACWWPILLARGGMRLGSCHLAEMLTMTMTVQMTPSGSERTNPFDYSTM